MLSMVNMKNAFLSPQDLSNAIKLRGTIFKNAP